MAEEVNQEELTFDQRNTTYQDVKYTQVYKKWFHSKSFGGFLSLRLWDETAMLNVDIGQTNEKNELVGNTSVWVPALKFNTYTRAVVSNSPVATAAFPSHNFAHYGGAMVEGKAVSRIFKVEYWDKEGGLASGFRFKAGHFGATKTATGAYQPDTKMSLRRNEIKVTHQEMAEIAMRLDYAIVNAIHTYNGEGTWLNAVTAS